MSEIKHTKATSYASMLNAVLSMFVASLNQGTGDEFTHEQMESKGVIRTWCITRPEIGAILRAMNLCAPHEGDEIQGTEGLERWLRFDDGSKARLAFSYDDQSNSYRLPHPKHQGRYAPYVIGCYSEDMAMITQLPVLHYGVPLAWVDGLVTFTPELHVPLWKAFVDQAVEEWRKLGDDITIFEDDGVEMCTEDDVDLAGEPRTVVTHGWVPAQVFVSAFSVEPPKGYVLGDEGIIKHEGQAPTV